MESLYPKSCTQTQVVCIPKSIKTHVVCTLAADPQPLVYGSGGVWCRTTHRQPDEEPQTKPDTGLFCYQQAFLGNLTNVCLLLPSLPSSRRHLPVVSPPAVLGTCLNFLPTSDLQTNCMLRSSSTKPLARSWTMPSTTWRLCRRPRALCFSHVLIFVSMPSTVPSANHVLTSRENPLKSVPLHGFMSVICFFLLAVIRLHPEKNSPRWLFVRNSSKCFWNFI